MLEIFLHIDFSIENFLLEIHKICQKCFFDFKSFSRLLGFVAFFDGISDKKFPSEIFRYKIPLEIQNIRQKFYVVGICSIFLMEVPTETSIGNSVFHRSQDLYLISDGFPSESH